MYAHILSSNANIKLLYLKEIMKIGQFHSMKNSIRHDGNIFSIDLESQLPIEKFMQENQCGLLLTPDECHQLRQMVCAQIIQRNSQFSVISIELKSTQTQSIAMESSKMNLFFFSSTHVFLCFTYITFSF